MNRKTNFTNDSFEVIKIYFKSTSLSYQTCLRSYLVKLLALKLTGQYWEHFLNDKNIPCIPPVFHDNKFGIDFREKVELFNTFFAEQCSLPKNNSELPKNLLFLTEKRLSNVQISNENIIKILSNLGPNKAHGHDMMSIRQLKLCGPSLYKLLSIM